MSRDRRDAERAARRARKLAERAKARARRTERHAERAAERAESEAKQAQWEAEKARKQADCAEQTASGFESSLDDEFPGYGPSRRFPERKRIRPRWKHRRYGYGRYGSPWARARKRRSAHLYRDRQRKKFLGVCAGVADYFGRPAWEIRLYTVLGLFLISSVVVPAYFITYFLMDDRPYYRRVTDRFDDTADIDDQMRDDAGGPVGGSGEKDDMSMTRGKGQDQRMSNVQAMKTAKRKFSDIEQRLRLMETHVTSSRFELQRELKKISDES